MRKNDYKKLVIFSVDKTRYFEAHRLLHGLGIKHFKTAGSYNGIEELGYMAIMENDKTEPIFLIKTMAFVFFNQESILVQYNDGISYLEYANGKKERLGQLREVSENYAKQCENYTIFNNKYYTTGY